MADEETDGIFAPMDPEALAEVARLERVIAEREAAEKLQPPVRLPVPPDGERAERENTRELREARRQNGVLDAPPAPLVPFISAEAVDQRLQAVSHELERIEAQTRHTMLLVMILAERMNLTSQEYERAIALAQRSEQAAKGQS